ncbi:ABC transporter ATP-binding protein [Winogradskya humida]|uniref:ABC transporter ATP-binding protein n=2 Tax=Winogradskya humida TaxID=113566 RepID=A0ABQ3ZIU4_9ACTN|nr:ABC transporter ATP-binding protein [Actinoplanes humidus]
MPPARRPLPGTDKMLAMAMPLYVTVSGADQLMFPGDGRVVVGRDPHCTVVLGDNGVSREHCHFELRGHQWTVVDTSRNGTYLGSERITALALRPGTPTVLRLGNFDAGPVLTVHAGDPGDEGAEPTSLAMAPITVAAPEAVREQYPFPGRPLTIGRQPDNDVIVDDLLVSRYHATVAVAQPGVALVTDLGGRNGTFVNGHPVHRSSLLPGDRLTIGRSTFSFDGVGALREHGEAPETSLAAQNLTVRYGETRVISDITFSVPPGSLIAIIGPSGAGKSTLLRALTGARAADEGHVYVDGIDLYPSYDEVRHRIGLVPQEDVLHDQLQLVQALRYAAALRLPDDVPSSVRDQRVDEVLTQLDLTKQRDLPIHSLSGGQRKRASVAMELLTEPSLLYLDEPTSGLDPLLDREVMRQLRSLADRGRTVVVVTHSTLHLDACHSVLALARGGRVAYFGPPAGLLDHFGARDYADAFSALSEEATEWAGLHSLTVQQKTRERFGQAASPAPPKQGMLRQTGLLMHRATTLLLADRRQWMMLVGLPFVLAAVVQTAPPEASLRWEPGPPQTGAATLLVILVLGAAFMGMAGSIRELVAERPIYQREWAIGLRSGAYLGSKIAVSAIICVLQAIVLGLLGLLGRDLPASGVILASPRLELIVVLALTAFTAAMAGLLASALAQRAEHTMSILVVAIMAQLVLSGGLYSIGGRPWLQALALFSPTRWGFASGAVTVDLRTFHILLPTDGLWTYTVGAWWFAMGALATLGLAYIVTTRIILRLQEQRPKRKG